MNITVSTTPANDTHLVFLPEESTSKPPDFSGKIDETAIRYQGQNPRIYCGIGKSAAVTADIVRTAAALGIRKAAELKRDSVSLLEPRMKGLTKSWSLALVEGALLGSYTFTKYKSEKTTALRSLEFVGRSISAKEAADAATLCACVDYARDLTNENAGEVTPERLAKEAQAIARASKSVTCTVLGENEIRRKGLGLLHAGGMGSPFPPRLIFIRYTGDPKSKKRTAIVGKGITFDSGGQNLKPTSSIETMRCDMSGAAVVLGVMKALAALRPKVNVIGVVAAAHNAIGSTAYFPGDTYKSYAGKTVEIISTDAEGRLALADAISYCIRHFPPTEIIDLATLTGAIITALGDTIAGLFSNNDALAEKLFESGRKTNERLWRLPVCQEHREAIKSDIADLRNVSKLKKGHASSITAAAFLEAFAGNLPWAHLDIAGTAFNEGESRGEVTKFGTGFGVRLLMDYFSNYKP